MDQLREISLGIADSEMHMGMFGRPWSAAGYDGFTCGHLEYGERHDGCIVQMHGPVSHAHWQRAFRLARNVSRFDVEVTVRSEEDARWVVRRHLGQMRRFNKRFKRPIQLSHKVDHNEGMTIYSGAPQSDVRLRIYDKEREAGQAQWSRCVRYEVQLRRHGSYRAASSFAISGAHASTCVSLLRPILGKRGALCRALKDFAQGTVSLETSRVRQDPSDVEKVCSWLRKSVAPSVQRLLSYTDRAMVLEALGLPPG